MTTDAGTSGPSHQDGTQAKGEGCVRKALAVLGVFFLLSVAAGIVGVGAFWWWAYGDGGVAGPTIRVNVERGDSLRHIAIKLDDAGLASPWPCTVVLARLLHVDRRLQPGEYAFSADEPPARILKKMLRTQPRPSVRVTFPEGWTLQQMAARLEASGAIADAARFEERAGDRALLDHLGIEAGTAEGYLFPDTYMFHAETPEEEVFERLVGRFWSVVLSRNQLGLLPGLNSPEAARLTFEEHIVLASIIEREAALAEEMPLIASVYHNRLRKGLRLESCATVRHALQKWHAPLTLSDLDVQSPFNTYRKKGLPPSPIGNPGRDAIAAAFRPVQSDFLYYVYKGEGRHAFSKTLREHNRARARYKDAWRFSAGQKRSGASQESP